MMMDLEPKIIAVSNDIFYEKIINIFQSIVSPFKKIWFYISIFTTNIHNKIQDRFHRWYSEFYQKRLDLFMLKMKKRFRLLGMICLSITISLFAINIFSNALGNGWILKSTPWISFGISGGVISLEALIYAGFYLFFKYYHFYYGNELIHEENREYTKQYVVAYAPKIAKFWTITGGGKDEGIAGFATMQIEGFKEDIMKRKSEIKKVCYIFGFNFLDQIIPKYLSWFASSNEVETKKNFLTLCERYRFFIKSTYRGTINTDEFKEDSKRLKNNILYTSKYIYDKGGINKQHFLNMLYDYIMLSVREYENQYIFSNQPFFEDLDTGRTAAKFSLNYLITRNQPNRNFNEKNKLGKTETVEYTEKVQFPFKDYLGFIETEVGTWYINLDRKITAMLTSLGIRDFKAFNRHILQHFFWYQADQDPYRVSKIFRELDHAFIHPDTRFVYLGGEGANMFIKRRLEALEKKLAKMADRYEKSINKNTKVDERIKKLNRYWIASSNIKYKNKMDDLRENKKYYNYDLHAKKIEEMIYDLSQKMALNIYKHSYVEKILTIGNSACVNGGNRVYTPKEILENPDIIKSNYSIKTTFKLSDCWRYNTHYMARIRKNRSEQSELNLMDAPKWDPDLEFKSEDVKDLGYVQGAEIMGLIVDEVIKTRYKRVSQ